VFSARAVSHTFYARVFAGAFFPWSAVVAGRAVDVIRGFTAGKSLESEERFLWLWTIVVIGFFSVARFKLDHYIFPAAPACCILAAHAWGAAAAETEGRLSGTRFGVHAIAALLIVGGSFGVTYLGKLDLELPGIAIVFPISLLAGGVVLMTQSARIRWMVPRNANTLIVTLLIAYATVVAVGFPVLERTRPTSLIARRLVRTTPATAPVGIYKLERWRASLRYYLDRPVERLENANDLAAFIARPEPVYIVMLRREYDELRRAGVPIRLMMQHRAVEGTTGRGLRRQRWGYLVVATKAPQP
jgi:hypothetical protein